MTLDEFVAKLKTEIAALELPSSSPAADDDYMKGVQERASIFRTEADRILNGIIAPRMKAIGSMFPNALSARKTESGHCTWWFGYTERFPSSTKLDVSVTHDEGIETLSVCYELLIVPVFVKYDRFDRFVVRLDQVNDDQIADWLERRLFGFLHTYMSLGTSDRDQTEGTATDPVCGMRVNKDHAAAFQDHAGHRYFFCSQTCRDEFVENPTRHVTVVTM